MVGPLRKDGQPDMRYKSNRESGSSNSVVQKPAPTTSSFYSSVNDRYDRNPPGPLRKDGQPDMRYAANKKHVVENNVKIPEKTPITITKAIDLSVPSRIKDGQPHTRYECNIVEEEYPPGPLRKDGKPDMRYAANKNCVAEDNSGNFFGISTRITKSTDPSVPLQIKDGQPRTRYECNNVEEEYPSRPLGNFRDFVRISTAITEATDPSVPLRMKDGQPPMRYECKKEEEEYPPGPRRKDGQPDMRYAANKKYVTEEIFREFLGISTGITKSTDPFVPLKIKDGQPHVRYECNKVEEEYPPGPLRKDGQPDMRYAANKRYVAERDANQVTANKESAENVKENDMGNVEVNCGLINAWSLFPKRDELKEKIEKSKLDFVTVTETWKMSDNSQLNTNQETNERQGGGVALFYRDSIKRTPRSRKHYETFECLETSLDVGAEKKIRLLSIYRPDKIHLQIAENDKNFWKLPISGISKIFLEEFKSLLAASNTSKETLCITGDLNVHVENPKSSRVKEFLQLIKSYGLVQHVKKPTHEDGGTLDLIITTPDLLVKKVRVSEFPSDHKFVEFKIQTEKKKEDIIKKEE
ncbi:LOW QUALITY PROTEIN: uncharacterized protein LOC116918935 [Daphnia magna]|uniref:LOW QUALITY PROTEIN: uncharacterized protein LOC116918935 n=1 Tax=Daphnia magna TaxID=35525 RepID=UPI001E1BC4D1|nr:LOW QUALITY PROTEIN: uncharacterized protein LOC116918935 [Daphnia magna]